MTRVHTVRVLSCHASLACGHHVHLRVHGFYPVAVACPACPIFHVSWVTTLAITNDDRTLIGKEDALPAPVVNTTDEPPAPEPHRWQAYTVGVDTGRRHESYDRPDEYVLHAPTPAAAMVLAARAAVANEAQDVESLITLDEDGLPSIHVVWVRTGMPTHPAETPGLAWADLRPDTPMPDQPPPARDWRCP